MAGRFGCAQFWQHLPRLAFPLWMALVATPMLPGCDGGPGPTDDANDGQPAADALKDGAADGGGSDDAIAADTATDDSQGGTDDAGADGGAVPLGCQSDSDCTKLGLQDLCHGPPTCDKAVTPPVCRVPAKPLVVCPPAPPCLLAACDPATGTCKNTATAEGQACDDGQPCTIDSKCSAGVCAGGDDVCPCKIDADCAAFDDGDPCTGKPICVDSGSHRTCKVVGAVKCPPLANGACLVHACDPKVGTCKVTTQADGSACNDGDPCSSGDFCKGGACKGGVGVCACKSMLDCKALDDNNPCNGVLFCDIFASSPVCKVHPASVPKCNPASAEPCHSFACDKATGGCAQLPFAVTASCDDGNPCSGGDACQSGVCAGPTAICACTKDADCAAQQPKNLCLGKLYCDKSVAGAFQCKLNPATQIVCPSAQDTACSRNTCQPLTGKCAKTAQPDDSPCNADGNPCTAGDRCATGLCVAGPNTCACEANGDCAPFQDSDLCNGTLYCATLPSEGAKVPNKVCVPLPSTVVTCPALDVGPCKAMACVAATGACAAVPLADATACDADGDPCSVGDTCVAGVCKAGVKACACKVDSDCAAFDDGDLCNGTRFCDKSALPFQCLPKPGSAVVCATAQDPPCKTNTCQPSTGECSLAPLDANAPCDDGNVCTVGTTCMGGTCGGGKAICACTSDADCSKIDDANLCNGKLVCDKSAVPHACKVAPSSVVQCPKLDAPCASAICEPSTGSCLIVPTPGKSGATCDDGDACTVATTCQGALCIGSALPCNDGNPCTLDTCDSAKGCLAAKISGKPCPFEGSAGVCQVGACVKAP